MTCINRAGCRVREFGCAAALSLAGAERRQTVACISSRPILRTNGRPDQKTARQIEGESHEEQLSDSQNLANEGALQRVDEAYLVERTTSVRNRMKSSDGLRTERYWLVVVCECVLRDRQLNEDPTIFEVGFVVVRVLSSKKM